jgi:hypothetical protein
MKQSLIIIIGFIFLISCNKDKFNTKPQLTFKSVNATTFAKGSDIKFNLTATDKEGDLTDSLFVIRLNRNCTKKDTTKFAYILPKFPTSGNLEAPIQVNYSYQGSNYPPLTPSFSCTSGSPRNDSCTFKFIIRDKAGNVSDSVLSPEIVLLK